MDSTIEYWLWRVCADSRVSNCETRLRSRGEINAVEQNPILFFVEEENADGQSPNRFSSKCVSSRSGRPSRSRVSHTHTSLAAETDTHNLILQNGNCHFSRIGQLCSLPGDQVDQSLIPIRYPLLALVGLMSPQSWCRCRAIPHGQIPTVCPGV